MFIKKYVKDGKTYYLLTLVFQNNKNEKPEFKKLFITEEFAKWLISCGVKVNEKEK